jgi:hypothetical protein
MSDNFIRLIIVTTGEDIDEEFNVHQPVRVIKQRALQGLPSGTDRNLFVLEYENQQLDEDKKIEEYVNQFGWQDGTVLELIPRPEVI